MTTKQNVHGEGNYEASRQYNEATKKFVESGKVDAAARAAAPTTAQEATEMKQAEQAALLRAKPEPRSSEAPRLPDRALDDAERDLQLPDDMDATLPLRRNGTLRR